MHTNQEIRLQRAADAFYLDRKARGLTEASIGWYRRYLGQLVTWLAAHDVTTVDGITLELLRAYMRDVQGRGLAPKTVSHYASTAKVFGKWLAAEGLVTSDPAERLPRPKVPKKVLPALTQEDVKKLLDECDDRRDKALLLFMLDTGARCAETVAVNVGDVDIKIGAVIIAIGKGQKGRTVYLGAQSRQALSRYFLTRDDLGPGDPLWTSLTSGERLGAWGVILALKRMGDRAGVHIHPHMLRRTFAIWSLRAGMDVARLAALLGHADLSTVQGYLAMIESDLETAHREHGAVDTILAKGGKR
jgi:integrase/recombinase XerD